MFADLCYFSVRSVQVCSSRSGDRICGWVGIGVGVGRCIDIIIPTPFIFLIIFYFFL